MSDRILANSLSQRRDTHTVAVFIRRLRWNLSVS